MTQTPPCDYSGRQGVKEKSNDAKMRAICQGHQPLQHGSTDRNSRYISRYLGRLEMLFSVIDWRPWENSALIMKTDSTTQMGNEGNNSSDPTRELPGCKPMREQPGNSKWQANLVPTRSGQGIKVLALRLSTPQCFCWCAGFPQRSCVTRDTALHVNLSN